MKLGPMGKRKPAQKSMRSQSQSSPRAVQLGIWLVGCWWLVVGSGGGNIIGRGEKHIIVGEFVGDETSSGGAVRGAPLDAAVVPREEIRIRGRQAVGDRGGAGLKGDAGRQGVDEG